MTERKTLSQGDINSLYQTIETSDNNANLILTELIADGYEVNSQTLRKHTVPAEDGEVPQRYYDQLDLYLHCVFNNAMETADTLINNGYCNTNTSSLANRISNHINPAMASRVAMHDANDVCWAITSPHEDALDNLLKLYDKQNLPVGINKKSAVLQGAALTLREKSLDSPLKPLDLAVVTHVAMFEIHKKKQHIQREIASNAQDKLEKVKQITEALGNSDQGLACFVNSKFTPDLKTKEPSDQNIRLLLARGATGSDEAYFPTDGEHIAPMGAEQHEKMSLSDFVEAHHVCFEPDLLRALAGDDFTPEQDNTPG